MKEDGVISLKPSIITFNEASSIPFGAQTALDFLQKAKLKEGHEVLIYGASGAVGNAAIQLCLIKGAKVTAVSS